MTSHPFDPLPLDAAPGPPGETIDRHNAVHWRGLRDHRLIVGHCPTCGASFLPLMPSCPQCGSAGADSREADGHGAVYSWVTAHRALNSAMEGQLPSIVAAIDLDVGCRIFGRLDTAPEMVWAGMRVRPRYVDHDRWTELRFAAAGEAS